MTPWVCFYTFHRWMSPLQACFAPDKHFAFTFKCHTTMPMKFDELRANIGSVGDVSKFLEGHINSREIEAVACRIQIAAALIWNPAVCKWQCELLPPGLQTQGAADNSINEWAPSSVILYALSWNYGNIFISWSTHHMPFNRYLLTRQASPTNTLGRLWDLHQNRRQWQCVTFYRASEDARDNLSRLCNPCPRVLTSVLSDDFAGSNSSSTLVQRGIDSPF